jgi:hypothetical protein
MKFLRGISGKNVSSGYPIGLGNYGLSREIQFSLAHDHTVLATFWKIFSFSELSDSLRGLLIISYILQLI